MEALIVLILLTMVLLGGSSKSGGSHGNMINPRADLSKNPGTWIKGQDE